MQEVEKRLAELKAKSSYSGSDIIELINIAEALIYELNKKNLVYAQKIYDLERRIQWYRNCTIQVVSKKP